MTGDTVIKFARRNFLKGMASAAGVVGLAPEVAAPITVVGAAGIAAAHAETLGPAPQANVEETSAAGYQSLGPQEIDFVEAMVNVMCPADGLTPNGVDCGLSTFIDRQLAGGYGKGERLYMRGPWKPGVPQQGYQLPLTPEQFFKAGLAAAETASQKAHGQKFSELPPGDADAFLNDVSAGRIESERISLSSWFNDLVYPLFVQACYADPIYRGNKDKVFWKMIGYPGLPATHTHDMVEFRGRRYPDAQHPKAISDFS